MTPTDINEVLLNPLSYVLYFEEEGFNKPHYYLILPTKNYNDFIILTMITSQIQKRECFYEKDLDAKDCLVYVSPDELSFLIKQSIIDCNKPLRISYQELILKPKLKALKTTINASLITNIAAKINSSKRIKPAIKKCIDLSKLK